MPIQQITIPYWLQIPQKVRNRLIEVFKIPRSEGATVQSIGGVMSVVSDGHTHPDLLAVSVEKMQEYLGSEKTEFWPLVEETLKKADLEVNPPVKEVPVAEQITCSVCEGTGNKHKKNCPKRD